MSVELPDTAGVRTGTAAEPDSLVGAPDTFVVARSFCFAAEPDTFVAAPCSCFAAAPDTFAAVSCSDIPVPQCVPPNDLQSSLRTGQWQPLIPLLPGTNSGRLSKPDRTDRLPDGSRMEYRDGDQDYGPRSSFL